MLQIPGVPKVSKRLTASLLIPLFIALSIFVFTKNRFQSTFTIESGLNKFKLSFNLQKSDESKLSDILSELDLPQSVKQGIEFELDATSQAKLAYVSPLKAKMKLGTNYLNFSGNLKRNLEGADFQFESIKLPDLTSLAIISRESADFLTDFSSSREYQDWISQNVKSENGVYLVVFGPASDFAVAFKNNSFRVDQLKKIKDSKGEPAFKEKTIDDTNFGLLNLSQSGSLLAIVTKDNWNIIASSETAAMQFSPESAETAGQVFPSVAGEGTAVFALYYKNFGNAQNAGKYISYGDKLSKILDKTDSLVLTLHKNSFSGSFSVK